MVSTEQEREFRAFLDRHLPALDRLARLLTGEDHDADDLVADALLSAWRRWDRVRHAESDIAYVRGIVINLARSRIRRIMRDRRRLAELGAEHGSGATDDPDTPAVIDLRRALKALPQGQRACVVLRYGLGLSEAETAQTLGISIGTVKSQTSKGSAALRHRITPRAPRPG